MFTHQQSPNFCHFIYRFRRADIDETDIGMKKMRTLSFDLLKDIELDISHVLIIIMISL